MNKKSKIIIIIVLIVVIIFSVISLIVDKSIKDYYFNPDASVRTDGNNQRGTTTN